MTYGPVTLREFSDLDVAMIMEMSTDPYVPLIGSLPANASQQEAHDYIDRQRGRLAEGTGFSFVIAAWKVPGLHRVQLHIEPWNTGSIKAAERAGYEREGLMRGHQEIGGQRRDMLLYATLRKDSHP